ncbi:MAG: metal-dependent transcriptional regulator [Eubacteriales bacterium]|nr:metal-dependent transcriptional regulator [Eubacteriales bacterium]
MRESGENYLETILLLRQTNPVVRSIDVANALGYSKPSISRAMNILKAAGHVSMEAGGDLRLTASGQALAEQIYERHRIISRFLMQTLSLPEEEASQDACRIEHVISQQTFDEMKRFVGKNEK